MGVDLEMKKHFTPIGFAFTGKGVHNELVFFTVNSWQPVAHFAFNRFLTQATIFVPFLLT